MGRCGCLRRRVSLGVGTACSCEELGRQEEAPREAGRHGRDPGMPLSRESNVYEAVEYSGIWIPVAGSHAPELYRCVRLVLMPLRFNPPQVVLAAVAGVYRSTGSRVISA